MADSGTQDPGPDAQVKALDDRFKVLEDKQRQQDGILQQILDRVTKGGTPGTGDASGAGATPASIAQQVRDEMKAADERRAREAKDQGWREDVTQQLEKLKSERSPREPEAGLRGQLQRAIFGRQD